MHKCSPSDVKCTLTTIPCTVVILQDKLRTVLSIWKKKQPTSLLGKAAQAGQTSSSENQYTAIEEPVLPSSDDKEHDSAGQQVESLFY